MPASSKSQFRIIQTIRSKYKSKDKAPEDKKWAFNPEWTDIDYDKLPEKHQRYKKFFPERRMSEYKAWYSPSSNWFYQFPTNGIHDEIANQELRMGEEEALKKGYYRIYVGNEIDIDSYKIPTEREFCSTRNIIEKNSYKNFKGTIWQTYQPEKDFYFSHQGFLFVDSIKFAESEIKSKYDIYIDMDGVLCDFNKLFYDNYKIKSEEYEKKFGKEKFWNDVEKINHFFLKLPWVKNSEKLWNYIKKYKPTILTTPTNSMKQCKSDKLEWIKNNLGNYRVIFEKEKYKYANSNSILIDDLDKNISRWKKTGGIAIKFLNANQVIEDLKKIL